MWISGLNVFMYNPFGFSEKVARESVYHSGVVSGHFNVELGDKELIDKFPDDYMDGIMVGMGLTDKEYKAYIKKYKKQIKRENTKDRHNLFKQIFNGMSKALKNRMLEA